MSELHLILVGSPRVRGASARFATKLAHALETASSNEGDPPVLVEQFSVAERLVSGCLGCGFCDAKPVCVIDDDMVRLYRLLDQASAVHVVCPVYFSGVPAQFKAVIDRLQLCYQTLRRDRESGAPRPPKRPMALYLFGDGGDPHGHSAAESEVRSAFAVAGFALTRIHSFIGKDKSLQSLHFLRDARDVALHSTRLDPNHFESRQGSDRR